MTFGRFIIRLFLALTVSFVIGFLCIAALIPVFRYRFVDAVLRGIAAGALLTLMMAAVDYCRRRTVIRRYGLPADYSPRQERRITTAARSKLKREIDAWAPMK